MKLLNGLAFLIVLAVAAGVWALYTLEPGLWLGTPWGAVHGAYLLLGAFALGLLVMGLYGLVAWVNAQTTLRRLRRELHEVRTELEALKQQHPQELPVIPDRETE